MWTSLRSGADPVLASKVKRPLVEECPVNLECVVRQTLKLGVHHLFLGEVVATHLDEAILDASDKVQVKKCKPFGAVPRRLHIEAADKDTMPV